MAFDLNQLHRALLQLHKALLEAQKVRYERDHGRIESSGQFLRLVLEHPSFDWLRVLSTLIARLDELSEVRDKDVSGEIDAMLRTLSSLLRFEGDPTFTAPYRQMIEEVPEALVAHVQLSRMLDKPAGAVPARPAAPPS